MFKFKHEILRIETDFANITHFQVTGCTASFQSFESNDIQSINRADGLEKQVLSGKICGNKSGGRQRTKYTYSPNNFVTRK